MWPRQDLSNVTETHACQQYGMAHACTIFAHLENIKSERTECSWMHALVKTEESRQATFDVIAGPRPWQRNFLLGVHLAEHQKDHPQKRTCMTSAPKC